MMAPADAAAVHRFWFGELRPDQWFRRDATVDAAVRERFANLYARAARTIPAGWLDSATGHVAAVVVLDQFPRHLFRNDPRAYATDGDALALAEEALARGVDRGLTVFERMFLCMPFQHSERADIQARSVDLFAAIGHQEAFESAQWHREIIERFGRFPHRNAILGRTSTAEEFVFLKDPKASF